MSTHNELEKRLDQAAGRQAKWTRRARWSQKRLAHWRKVWNKTKNKADKTESEQALRKIAFWRNRRDESLRRRAFWKEVVKKRRIRLNRWLAKNQRIDWNGHPPVRSRKVKRALRYAQREFGAVVTSTTGGQHSPTSWHYRSMAVDFVCSDMAGCQLALESRFGASYFLELFGPAERYIKNGYVIKGSSFPAHEDHIHIAA